MPFHYTTFDYSRIQNVIVPYEPGSYQYFFDSDSEIFSGGLGFTLKYDMEGDIMLWSAFLNCELLYNVDSTRYDEIYKWERAYDNSHGSRVVQDDSITENYYQLQAEIGFLNNISPRHSIFLSFFMVTEMADERAPEPSPHAETTFPLIVDVYGPRLGLLLTF